MDANYSLALVRIKKAKKQKSTELNLSGFKLTTIPNSIGGLINLTKLDLSENQLSKLPESMRKLTNLRILNLESNKLAEFPESLGSLIELKELRLGINNISTLPEFIMGFINLSRLDLDFNEFTTIPPSIGGLTNLINLDLSYNNLVLLPEAIGNLTKLKKFSIEGNELREIPDEIGRLINLEWLLLSNSELTTLPETLKNLMNLIKLDLDNNQLSKVPEVIGLLTSLMDLNLANNKLTELPENVENLTNLVFLDLIDNQFNVGAEIFNLPAIEQIQEILKWQRAQKEGTLQPIHEAKVIFIGESNYGKTHLIEFLKEGEIRRKIKTTHGIERSQMNIPYKPKDIRLNIWDLGGQEFMRSTHQFFFSERTLYVLVTLARTERNDLNHWLKLANQLGKKAPVLVVINKIDEDKHDLDRKSLQRDYPNIIDFVRTSIKDCDEDKAVSTLENLKKKISTIVSDKDIMPSVFEERPPEWFTVKEELEKLETKGKDFITYEEYENLEFIKDLSEDDRKRNLKLLSMIGAVVSYVDDPRLIHTNVINPQWIMDGVYAIINDPIIKDETKGRLHIEDLERILDKTKFPKGRHGYLLELMQKFDLCYAAKDERDIFFIPDLFEDIEPDSDWDSEKSMHFRYDYDDFPPDVFMTRFIVEMHQDIEYDLRWRSGVFITNRTCKAKVYQSFRKNYIHIEVIGTKVDRRLYLYAIREGFRKLHKPFPEMKIKQEVLYKEHWIDYTTLSKLEVKNKSFYHVELDEELPITDILNGYSSKYNRLGESKTIRVFLASSGELKAEREQFEIFINRENKMLNEKGIFIRLEIWEDAIEAMSKTRLQDEYNKLVKNCDIFVSLFFTKVGKYTLEEFEIAFGQFKETGKPLLFTYFKDAEIKSGSITDEIISRLNFQKKLEELGHFKSEYENISDLKLQFKNQLERILPKL